MTDHQCTKCSSPAEWRYRRTPTGREFTYLCDVHMSLAMGRNGVPSAAPYVQHKSRVKRF